jgi:YggT family protein
VAGHAAGHHTLPVPNVTAYVRQNAAESIVLLGDGHYLCHNLLWLEPSMTSLFQILLKILDIAKWIILAHIIMSWLINFQVLNLRQQLVAQVWNGLNRTLEPVYNKVRSILPRTPGLDLAPFLVLVALYALRIVLINNMAAFY